MGLFSSKYGDKIDLAKKFSPKELQAVLYSLYYASNTARDSEGMELSRLLTAKRRTWVFPVEYDYIVSAVESVHDIMERRKATGNFTEELPRELLDDLNSAMRKL